MTANRLRRLASLRRRLHLPDDASDRFIARTVRGKSFADVGGLWGVVNEKLTVAHAAGASSLAMIDRVDLGDELWRALRARLADAGIPGFDAVSADVLELGGSDAAPCYDVVHCSGVLYHLPNPLLLLESLRRLTRERLILSSAVTASRVETRVGTLVVPDCGVIFVPALAGREREILREYWDEVAEGAAAVGLNRETEWSPDDYVPWWWLPTVPALKALCSTAGFVVEDGEPSWGGNAYTLQLRRPA